MMAWTSVSHDTKLICWHHEWYTRHTGHYTIQHSWYYDDMHEIQRSHHMTLMWCWHHEWDTGEYITWDYYLMLTSWMRYRGVYHMRLLSDVDAMNEIHRNISQDYYLICWHHEWDTGRMSISHNTPNWYIMNEMVMYHTTLLIQQYDEWDTVQHVPQPLLTQLWC